MNGRSVLFLDISPVIRSTAQNDSLLAVDLLNLKESIVLIHGDYIAAFLHRFP